MFLFENIDTILYEYISIHDGWTIIKMEVLLYFKKSDLRSLVN